MNESSIKISRKAVQTIKCTALANEITLKDLAPRLGINRQTLAERFNRKEMKLDEFVAASHELGISAYQVLKTAEEEVE